MTAIIKSNCSYKRVVDKAVDDDCQWLATLSVQEDPNGPNVEEQQEPIEQRASNWDIEAQAFSSKQDMTLAVTKCTSVRGLGESMVVERKAQDHDSLQAHSVESHEATMARAMERYMSKDLSYARDDPRVWVGNRNVSKAKASSLFVSIKTGLLRQTCKLGLISHPCVMTKPTRFEAFLVACGIMDDAHKFRDDSWKTVTKAHEEVDDMHLRDSADAYYYYKKKQSMFGKIKKTVLVIVSIVIGLGTLAGVAHHRGSASSNPTLEVASVQTNAIQARMPTQMPTVVWNDGNKTQEDEGAVSKLVQVKSINISQVNCAQPFDLPDFSPSSQALVILPLPTQSALPSKIEDWIPTLSSTMPWKDRSESEEDASKAVAIFQGSSSSSSGAPATIWKLSFEYFELEETGDVHVGIVCDTGFTGADATSKLLYGGPVPLFFKSRTVAPNEVTLDHSMDWHTGLPLITVGFGVNRNRITIVCGDMPSYMAPQATETDAPSNDSTSLALFQGPTAIATFAMDLLSVQAVPIRWVHHLPYGHSCDSKALVIWQPGRTNRDSVSESKILLHGEHEVKLPTGSKAFVVAFDVFLLQGRASLDIHLECVYKDTMPTDSENVADNPQVLFLSHTFSKHQVDVSVRRSGNQSLVTIGFWDDEFGIEAICEDFDAFGSSSSSVPSSLPRTGDPGTVEEAQATPMLAPQPEPPFGDLSTTVCGLGLLLFLTLCGTVLAVKQLSKRRIDQVPRLQAVPSAQVPCRQAAPSAQVLCSQAARSDACSSKKGKPPGILKPRIRKANERPIRFDKVVTVREYHRTVGVRPFPFCTSHSDYALALDWAFAEGKAKMEHFGHGRTANGEDCRVRTANERRNILMEAGFDDAKLEHLEAGARALRQGT